MQKKFLSVSPAKQATHPTSLKGRRVKKAHLIINNLAFSQKRSMGKNFTTNCTNLYPHLTLMPARRFAKE